jgi:hypothetical protein
MTATDRRAGGLRRHGPALGWRALRCIAGVLALGIGAIGARADEAFLPPARLVVTSPDGRVAAISDPSSATTTVEQAGTHQLLWRLPGWHRWIFVANDGRHAVVGNEGMNLIPQDYRDELVLFSFWREGRLVREITVKAFVPDRRMLQKTVSHYHWGAIKEIDAANRLVVVRADGKTFRFDLDTGLAVP